jgi:hypothetical protein
LTYFRIPARHRHVPTRSRAWRSPRLFALGLPVIMLGQCAPDGCAPPTPAPAVHYDSCAEVRDAGADPLYAGQPGYASHLDRDGDGVACE